jgi:hypothetical protein
MRRQKRISCYLQLRVSLVNPLGEHRLQGSQIATIMPTAVAETSCCLLICRRGKSNPGIWAAANQPAGQITSDFQKSRQAPFAKIFRFAPGPNQFTDSPRLVPTRGADRASSRNAGRDAVDAAASGEQVRAGRMALTRTAKSCGSDAPMPASSLREAAQATVSNKPGHREEHEVSRKTIARGMPGNSGVTVVTTLVCLFFYTRDCGCIGRPAFPAPSVQRGEWFLQNFGRIAPRDRDALSNAV